MSKDKRGGITLRIHPSKEPNEEKAQQAIEDIVRLLARSAAQEDYEEALKKEAE